MPTVHSGAAGRLNPAGHDWVRSAGTFAPGYSCLVCEQEKTREKTWMAADRSAAELERFLAERADHLLRTAVLLTGNRDAGEDLLQTAVERLLRRWRRRSSAALRAR